MGFLFGKRGSDKVSSKADSACDAGKVAAEESSPANAAAAKPKALVKVGRANAAAGAAEPASEPAAPKVSVLTPVYNVEQYLPECLDSLVAQKLKDIEFICINDGSTDGSLAILKEYAARDSRFVIIDKANSGYGSSMNCGLRKARGEYVGIVESDDFASPNMFRDLYKFAKRHNCDLVKANYYAHDDTGDYFRETFAGQRYRKVFKPAKNFDAIKKPPVIWSAVYRRSMLVENGIRFNETPGASFQDTSFVQRVWFTAKRAAVLKKGYLHYRLEREGSSQKSTSKVYEVCSEFAMTEDYLRQKPAKFKRFAPLLQCMKLDTYRWNFNRIALDLRKDFMMKWAEEFRDAQEQGLLHEDLFSVEDWALVQELLANPESCFENHVQGFEGFE